MIRIKAEGLAQLGKAMAKDEAAARKAASISVNVGTRFARTEGKRRILLQVALTPGYVNANLTVVLAKNEGLVGKVIARFRPTSLARFAKNRAGRKRRTPIVQVKRNSPGREVNKAFFLSLNAGTTPGVNVGIAIRLKPGSRVRGRKKAVSFSKKDSNLVLLYSASIEQVFKTVRGDMNPDVLTRMDREFERQFLRLTR